MRSLSVFLLLGCLCSLHVADAARDPSAGAANSCAGDQTPLTLFDPSAVAGGARCLDGTPAGYYLHLNPSSDDWVVFLEGGGLCVEVIDCLLRKNSSLGSSSFWDRCRAGGNNIASPNAAGNPFAGYNLVYVPYCSGDTWAGNSTAKNNVLGGLYTSGHVILRTLIEDLQRQHGLGSKPHQRLLLSGGSAGGIGVFMNADHVSSWLPSVDVKAAPQAGFYIPEGALLYLEYALGLNISVDNLFSEYVAGLEGFDVAYDSSCVAAMKAAQRPETLCWDATVHYPFVETPLFVAENIFDANQIFDIMIAPSKVLSNGSYPWEVRQFINYYGTHMLNSLKKHAVDNGAPRGNGLFSPSCLSHTDDLCASGGPTVGGTTFGEALFGWWNRPFNSSEAGPVFIDTCKPTDPTGGPCNANCTC